MSTTPIIYRPAKSRPEFPLLGPTINILEDARSRGGYDAILWETFQAVSTHVQLEGTDQPVDLSDDLYQRARGDMLLKYRSLEQALRRGTPTLVPLADLLVTRFRVNAENWRLGFPEI